MRTSIKSVGAVAGAALLVGTLGVLPAEAKGKSATAEKPRGYAHFDHRRDLITAYDKKKDGWNVRATLTWNYGGKPGTNDYIVDAIGRVTGPCNAPA